MRSDAVKRNLPVALCALALACCCAWSAARVDAAQRSYDAAASELSAAKSAAEVAATAATVGRADAYAKATGVPSERRDADEAVLEGALSAMLTWDSGASYEQARAAAVDAGVPAGSQALTVFMPEAAKAVRADGSEYYLIDNQGLSVEFKSLDAAVPLSTNGLEVEWLALATASSDAGGAAVDGRVAMVATVTADGAISSASAWGLSG